MVIPGQDAALKQNFTFIFSYVIKAWLLGAQKFCVQGCRLNDILVTLQLKNKKERKKRKELSSPGKLHCSIKTHFR